MQDIWYTTPGKGSCIPKGIMTPQVENHDSKTLNFTRNLFIDYKADLCSGLTQMVWPFPLSLLHLSLPGNCQDLKLTLHPGGHFIINSTTISLEIQKKKIIRNESQKQNPVCSLLSTLRWSDFRKLVKIHFRSHFKIRVFPRWTYRILSVFMTGNTDPGGMMNKHTLLYSGQNMNIRRGRCSGWGRDRLLLWGFVPCDIPSLSVYSKVPSRHSCTSSVQGTHRSLLSPLRSNPCIAGKVLRWVTHDSLGW